VSAWETTANLGPLAFSWIAAHPVNWIPGICGLALLIRVPPWKEADFCSPDLCNRTTWEAGMIVEHGNQSAPYARMRGFLPREAAADLLDRAQSELYPAANPSRHTMSRPTVGEFCDEVRPRLFPMKSDMCFPSTEEFSLLTWLCFSAMFPSWPNSGWDLIAP
jgi:hypothetical protein